MNSPRKYGWRRQKPDPRDWNFSSIWSPPLGALPARVDLRAQCPPVFDQGNLGSCTANAIANAHYFDQLVEDANAAFTPSRLFIYFNERDMTGNAALDAGASNRDGIKSIATLGVCAESLWPYDVAKYAARPPSAAYSSALGHASLSYYAVDQSAQGLKTALAAGFPIVSGICVYASFESEIVALTGGVPMPMPGESLLGGHAVLSVGYDDTAKTWLMMNSWGAHWGKSGYFTLPYGYLENPNLSSDFWCIKTVKT